MLMYNSINFSVLNIKGFDNSKINLSVFIDT